MQDEYASVFISHAGVHHDSFAGHLQQALDQHGVTTFTKAHASLNIHAADSHIKVACQNAKLVIFVVTRDFLRSANCMNELRWALAQRSRSNMQLPEILPLLYPSGNVQAYTRAELNGMPLTDKQHITDMLTMGTINVDHLDPLTSELTQLIERHSPSKQFQPPHGQHQAICLEQRISDIAVLARICCHRADAYGR